MRRLIALLLFLTMLLVTTMTASADPITCPNGQHSEKVNGVWLCVNGGGAGDPHTEDPRNPNK